MDGSHRVGVDAGYGLTGLGVRKRKGFCAFEWEVKRPWGFGMHPYCASLQQNIHSVQFAVLHYAANLARILNVGERISVNENQVGKFAGFDAAEITGRAESISSYCGRTL